MTGNIGGLENYIMYQYRQFDKSKLHIDFISAYKNVKKIAFQDEILSNGSRIFKLTNYKEWDSFLSSFKGKYHTIIFNNTNPLELYMLSLVKKKGDFRRIIIHSHNGGLDYPAIFKRFFNKDFKRRQKEFKEIGAELWACSEIAGRWMFGNDAEFTIIKNGIDTNTFKFNPEIRKSVRSELGFSDEDYVIGNIARFAIQKNHSFMIQVFHEALKHIPNAKLVLVGQNAPKISMLKQITEMRSFLNGTHKAISFLGLRKDTCRLYQGMDLFILPSLYEGLPVVGVEAQCSGLPCLFSDTITKEAALIETTLYLPIKPVTETAEIWASEIARLQKSKLNNRINCFETIREKGFDIKQETKKVEDLLLS